MNCLRLGVQAPFLGLMLIREKAFRGLRQKGGGGQMIY